LSRGRELDEAPLQRTGRVDFGGIVKEVSLACVPEAGVGDYVIVHVGMAISKVDPEEAQRVLEYLKQIDELYELDKRKASSTKEDGA
jgi:hydrogenase expression/formation protein HypC